MTVFCLGGWCWCLPWGMMLMFWGPPLHLWKGMRRECGTPGVCPELLVSLECLHEPGAFGTKRQIGANLGIIWVRSVITWLLTTSRREKIDFSPHFDFETHKLLAGALLSSSRVSLASSGRKLKRDWEQPSYPGCFALFCFSEPINLCMQACHSLW